MDIIECLQERGLVDNITSEDIKELVKRPTKVYLGFDPTNDSLHLGSMVAIMMLAWFQRYGHTPVVLVGGATGRIGDPSFKDKERPLISVDDIKRNVIAISQIFSKILDFSPGLAQATMVDNFDWLGTFHLIDFLRDVGKYFRVGTMLAKESVKSRMTSEEGLSFTEFSYQILQSYDFYHLFKNEGVSIQLGGSDQWGNITAGIDFVRKMTGQTVFGLTFPLLLKSDGKKFGKTETGAVWLSENKTSPYQLYQYLFSVADADVIKLLKMLTFLDMQEIRKIEKSMSEEDYVPNSAQRRLADEILKIVHGEGGLALAKKVTETISPGAQTSLDTDTLEEISKQAETKTLKLEEVLGKKYIDLLFEIGLVPTKSEASRLVKNLGAYLNNIRIEDSKKVIEQQDLIDGRYLLFAAGKKKKILVKILA